MRIATFSERMPIFERILRHVPRSFISLSIERRQSWLFETYRRRFQNGKKAAKSGFFLFDARNRLALRELLATARLVQADLLAFNLTRIAGNKSGLRQHRFQRRIIIQQCAGNAVAHGTGLT